MKLDQVKRILTWVYIPFIWISACWFSTYHRRLHVADRIASTSKCSCHRGHRLADLRPVRDHLHPRPWCCPSPCSSRWNSATESAQSHAWHSHSYSETWYAAQTRHRTRDNRTRTSSDCAWPSSPSSGTSHVNEYTHIASLVSVGKSKRRNRNSWRWRPTTARPIGAWIAARCTGLWAERTARCSCERVSRCWRVCESRRRSRAENIDEAGSDRVTVGPCPCRSCPSRRSNRSCSLQHPNRPHCQSLDRPSRI